MTLAWKNEDHLLDFTYGYQHIPYEAFPNQRMDMTDNRSDQFNLGYSGHLGMGHPQGAGLLPAHRAQDGLR